MIQADRQQENRPFQGGFRSPLTDSNRRPPSVLSASQDERRLPVWEADSGLPQATR
jgi:hypothetical protein